MFKDHPVTVGFSVCRPSPLSKPEICRRLCQEVREREKGRGTRKEGKRGRFQAGGARETSEITSTWILCIMLSGKLKIQIIESKYSLASVLTVALGVLGVLGELLVGVRLRSEARDRNGDDIADRTPDRAGGRTHLPTTLKI